MGRGVRPDSEEDRGDNEPRRQISGLPGRPPGASSDSPEQGDLRGPELFLQLSDEA